MVFFRESGREKRFSVLGRMENRVRTVVKLIFLLGSG